MIRMPAPRLVGLVAVNVSWDSGLMELTPDLAAAGWTTVGRFAMTPVIDVITTQSWPMSSLSGRPIRRMVFLSTSSADAGSVSVLQLRGRVA
jgi:hypothetical protein